MMKFIRTPYSGMKSDVPLLQASSKFWNPSFLPTKEGRMQGFQRHRRRIERAASAKFDRGQLEPDGSTILVRAADLV